MHRQFIVAVGCMVCLAAAPAWTSCLETVATLPYVPNGDASAVAVSGSFAYYNSGPVLYAVDVSAPADPQIVGEVTLPDDIAKMAVKGSIAYVTLGSAGLCTVDISSPSAPEVAFCLQGIGRSGDVAVAGDYLYLAGESAGLRVFDLENPTPPVVVGTYDTPGRSWKVSVARSGSCTYAFVADGQWGLRIVDVSTPSSPVEVAHVDASMSPEFISDVAISGGYAFVTDSWEGLRVFDVSTPSSPVEVGGGRNGMYMPLSVAVSGSTAYVAGSSVVAFDVSVPAAPEVVADNGAWGFTYDMAVADGYVYVAQADDGLSIFRECDSSPANFGSIMCGAPPESFLSFIPAVALAGGASGSFFQTDVEISNAGDDDAEVTFAWLPRGEDNPNPLVSAAYVLAAGESRFFDNALAEIFGLGSDAVGALRLTSSDESVIGMSRIKNVATGDVGTFGAGIPAIRTGEMIRSGERRRITFLSETTTERANVGCVNGTDRPIQVQVGIHDTDGTTLAVRSMRLGPYANDQINRVLQPWRPMRGYVDVWSESDGALFTCYGSVVDNLTNDPMIVLPQ